MSEWISVKDFDRAFEHTLEQALFTTRLDKQEYAVASDAAFDFKAILVGALDLHKDRWIVKRPRRDATIEEWRSIEAQFLKTTQWQCMAALTRMRDNYRCQLCDHRENGLNVHHRHYRNSFGFESLDDLITLCRPCHAKHHDKDLGLVEETVHIRDRESAGLSDLDVVISVEEKPITTNRLCSILIDAFKAERKRISGATGDETPKAPKEFVALVGSNHKEAISIAKELLASPNPPRSFIATFVWRLRNGHAPL